MIPGIGDLVYVNGNQAAIVIGYGIGADGEQDGSVIVGTFSGAQQFEAGHYGAQPSLAGENPPSFIPETQTVQPVAATGPILATAGDTPAGDVAGDAPASVVQTSEQAGSGAGVVELSGPAVPGSTAVDFEAANAEAFVASDDEERAEFEAWKAQRVAGTAPDATAAPTTPPADAGTSHGGL